MNPQSRLAPTREPAPLPRKGRVHAAELGETSEDLPTLAHILARYREHGTLAGSVAVPDPTTVRAATTSTSNPRPFAEVIEGLQTRELDGSDLFERFFGPSSPPPASPTAPR